MKLTLVALTFFGLFACGERLGSPTSILDALAENTRRRATPAVVELKPPCQSPASLTRAHRPAAAYMFIYVDGVDARAATAKIAAEYDLFVRHVFVGPPFQGFDAQASEAVLASLRCDPVIASVYQEVESGPAKH